MTPHRLILASASPRRQVLLRQLGISFDIAIPHIDETHHANESYEAYAKRMAIEKAQVVVKPRCPDNILVLAADTCGEIDGQLLTKPNDITDAKRLLRLLSGREHLIYSAFALTDGQRLHAEVVRSVVRMRVISDAEITAYWATGEPADKAGAYAIQGLGAQFVSQLSGSYSAVMGLPLFELSQALATYRFRLL